jgi:hypothetical protein
MTSDELLDCDAELAHDCEVANDLAATLEGLELAPLSRPPEL